MLKHVRQASPGKWLGPRTRRFWGKTTTAALSLAMLASFTLSGSPADAASAGVASSGSKPCISASNAAATRVPPLCHVFVIMLENHSYSDIMYEHDVPYLHYLASHYGLATQYYGITNPSAPNRVGILSGHISKLELPGMPGHNLPQRNIVDQLTSHGLSWGAFYQRSHTSTAAHPVYAYQSGSTTFQRFKDIANDPARLQHLQPLRQLKADLKTGQVPNYIWITPNGLADMEGNFKVQGAGPGAIARDPLVETYSDNWLQRWIPRIMHSKAWHTGTSAIFIQFDETSFDASMPQDGLWASYAGVTGSPVLPAGTVLEYSTSRFPFPGGVDGGGHSVALVITNRSHHLVSSTPYNEYSVLKTIEEGFGLSLLGHAAQPGVHSMRALFRSGAAPRPPVKASQQVQLTVGSTSRYSSTPVAPAVSSSRSVTSNGTVSAPLVPYLTEGTNDQAAAQVVVHAKPGLLTYPHALTLSLSGSTAVRFATDANVVGTTGRISNPGIKRLSARFAPAVITPTQIRVPLSPLSGNIAAASYVTGAALDVPPGTPAGAVTATVSSDGQVIGQVTLAEVGKPRPGRYRPRLLAPVIHNGLVSVRFIAPTGSPAGQRFAVRIVGVNPAAPTLSDVGLNERFLATTVLTDAAVSNSEAQLTALAGKQYWVQVALAGAGEPEWSRADTFTARGRP